VIIPEGTSLMEHDEEGEGNNELLSFLQSQMQYIQMPVTNY
jgi:hypothetical protein